MNWEIRLYPGTAEYSCMYTTILEYYSCTSWLVVRPYVKDTAVSGQNVSTWHTKWFSDTLLTLRGDHRVVYEFRTLCAGCSLFRKYYTSY